MNKHQIIDIRNIIFLPKQFYDENNISIYSLLKRSGYFDYYNQISEANIFDELTKYPECIDLWLNWSENKRSNSGWYLKENENGKYIVGYFPAKENLNAIEYVDRTEACAVFIKREIEDIRKS